MRFAPDAPTIGALHAAYADGRLDPGRLVAETYRRIAALDDRGIFISLIPEEEALAAAAALGRFDPRAKPLWGIPFAVKDNIDLAGLPTTAGCPDFAYCPTESATAVRLLVAAGAIPIGKTNLDQFATGLAGVRTPFPVPRNPFDPAIVPGGSSSGSAVAVARGLVPFALGTDTAGSGRIPAGFNNIVGLKPTRGTVSTRGVVPACRSLDCLSVFAPTVDDAAAVLDVIAGFDPLDPYSRPVSAASQPAVSPPARLRLRLGVPDSAGLRFFGDRLGERAFRAVLDDLAAIGAGLTEVDLAPCFAAGELLYDGPWLAERYLAVGDFIARRPASVHPVVAQVISPGAAISAVEAFAGFHRLAELRRAADELWRTVDVLVVPTVPRPRSLADLAADPIGANSELGTYSSFVNLLDLCALAVPANFRADGLPFGITFIAPAGCDSRIAALGRALQARAGVPPGALAAPG